MGGCDAVWALVCFAAWYLFSVFAGISCLCGLFSVYLGILGFGLVFVGYSGCVRVFGYFCWVLG